MSKNSEKEVNARLGQLKSVEKEIICPGFTPLGEHDGSDDLGWNEAFSRNEAGWCGVGSDVCLNKTTFIVSSMALETARLADDPKARDGRVNTKFAEMMWSYVTNSTASAASTTSGIEQLTGDIRMMLLKIKLYDHARQQGRGFPSGVEWAIPVRAPIAQQIVATDKLMTWDFKHIVIANEIIEHVIRQDGGCIIVGDEVWALKDSDTCLIYLDVAAETTSGLWCLQVVSRLPYPLCQWFEGFMISEMGMGGQSQFHYFARNEGLVSIPWGGRRIIFVVTSHCREVNIGGVRCRVTQMDKDEVPDIAPMNSRELILGCIDYIVKERRPLCEVFEPWLWTRSPDRSINWGYLDTLASLLCERFPPQVEVLSMSAHEAELHWVCEGYRSTEFGTENIPGTIILDEDRKTFFSNLSVSAFDQVYGSYAQANKHPILMLGVWSNDCELVTGCGIAKCAQGMIPITVGPTGNEKRSSPLGRIEKALLLRRGFEEFKRSCSITDAIVNPNSYAHLKTYWEELLFSYD